MSLRARLAAWIDRTFWPGLDERQPCLTASEVRERNGWRSAAQLAQMRQRDDETLAHNAAFASLADQFGAARRAAYPELVARRRARSLRVSLC